MQQIFIESLLNTRCWARCWGVVAEVLNNHKGTGNALEDGPGLKGWSRVQGEEWEQC
jgi:hypothetical protein